MKTYRIPRVRLSLVREGSEPFDCPAAMDADEAATIAHAFLRNLPNENLIALCLDSRNRVRAVVTVAVGGIHACAVTAADVLRAVLATGRGAFILAHNHPGGDPCPSREDVSFTKRIKEASAVVGIGFLDSIIVADSEEGDGFRSNSMRELSLL